MKTKNTLLLTMITVISFISCNTTNPQEALSKTAAIETEKTTIAPILSFEEHEYDFGTITEGEIVKHTFMFTNTGNAPLLIINAKGSCGCTVSEWPKEPIAPGATKNLLVSFNSNGKPNLQNKQVTITANTAAGKEVLKIKAMVTPKAKSMGLNK